MRLLPSPPRLAGLAIAAAVLTAPAGAAASIGTGVGAAPLTLGASVHAGKTYTVRWLYVKNTGTIRSEYQVKVTRFSPGSSRPVPAGWVRLTPSTFRLSPGAIERVTVSVAIPASAPGGPYLGDLLAATYASHTPGATALGAAAADQLTFRLPAGRSFPWPIIAIACAAALAVATGMAVQRNRKGSLLREDQTPGEIGDARSQHPSMAEASRPVGVVVDMT